MQLIDAAALMHFPLPVKLRWQRRVLHFKRPAATSRGVLTERTTYIITAETPLGSGEGECCVMPGLLPEPTPAELNFWCHETEKHLGLPEAPSAIRFGLECALLAALHPGQPRWDTPFSRGEAGIRIHHLIWMDDIDKMLAVMQQGIEQGFSCLKMKIGALPFAQEMEMLRQAHAAFPQAELRVDANGAFSPDEALRKLDALAAAGVRFIEQPIRPGQWEAMADICRHSPVPIALDEELIGAPCPQLLDAVPARALVIKPGLHGGLLAAERWAMEAEARGMRWWVNSALESHVGLTALAEWCGYAAPDSMHGLGKGNLYADDDCKGLRLQGNALKMESF